MDVGKEMGTRTSATNRSKQSRTIELMERIIKPADKRIRQSNTARSFSSEGVRSPLRQKQYRMTSQRVESSLCNNIKSSFTPSDSKIYKEIRTLNDELNPQQARQLQKMLEKFCIKSTDKRRRSWFGNVNVPTVSTMYVKEKSTEKQQQTQIKLIRQDIERVSTGKSAKNKITPFFQLTSDRIRQFQTSRYPFNKKRSHKMHPILDCYNKQYDKVMRKYKDGDDIFHVPVYEQFPDGKNQQEAVLNEKTKKLYLMRRLQKYVHKLTEEKKREVTKQPFQDNLC